jgi:hypothetical protein
MFLVASLVSCSQQFTIEDMAKNSAEQYFTNSIGKIEISNIETETKYKNDSLCIIEAIYDIKLKNAVKKKDTTEYVYLLHSNVAYETIRSEDFDDVEFFSREEYEKKKIGEIYESLSYDDAMYYFAAILINEHGRKVNDHDRNVYIPTPLGNWKLYNIEDKFGDKTAEKYLGVKGKGIIEFDANKKMDMSVYLFIRNDRVYFKFHEGDMQYLCADNGPIIISLKGSDGETCKYDFVIQKNGEIVLSDSCEKVQSLEKILSLINKEGIMTGAAQRYNTHYIFKIDLSGYKEANKRLISQGN